jgi:hypothetical protein
MTRTFNLAFFLSIFGVYLYSCSPHIPPYRDSGEMASVLLSLGIAHAPGYPLYVLLGKIFSLNPLGNLAFRINVFSALAAAFTIVLLFHVMNKWMTNFPAFIASVAFGFSIRFWELACAMGGTGFIGGLPFREFKVDLLSPWFGAGGENGYPSFISDFRCFILEGK